VLLDGETWLTLLLMEYMWSLIVSTSVFVEFRDFQHVYLIYTLSLRQSIYFFLLLIIFFFFFFL